MSLLKLQLMKQLSARTHAEIILLFNPYQHPVRWVGDIPVFQVGTSKFRDIFGVSAIA